MGFLGDAVLARCDGTSTMCAVAVTVLIDIILRYCLSPRSTALELFVKNVDASVDDIDVNTLATIVIIFVLGKGTEGKLGSVTDTC